VIPNGYRYDAGFDQGPSASSGVKSRFEIQIDVAVPDDGMSELQSPNCDWENAYE